MKIVVSGGKGFIGKHLLDELRRSGIDAEAVESRIENKSDVEKVKSNAADRSASAKVNFSEEAQKINKLRELATPDLDAVDEDKVAYFQNLIDSGKYEVDASAVADRMVDEHLIR